MYHFQVKEIEKQLCSLPQFLSFDLLSANNDEGTGGGGNSHKLEKTWIPDSLYDRQAPPSLNIWLKLVGEEEINVCCV